MKCHYCKKPVSEKDSTSISIGVGKNQTEQAFCSDACFKKYLKSTAKNVKTLADKKVWLSTRRAYIKARRQAVRSLEFIDLDSLEIAYLFDSLSKKDKENLALKHFGCLCAESNLHVPSILKKIEEFRCEHK